LAGQGLVDGEGCEQDVDYAPDAKDVPSWSDEREIGVRNLGGGSIVEQSGSG
jgi:hypothetical protein